MSMTWEEARIELQAMKNTFEEYEPGGSRCQMALKVALSALRPVSRERVAELPRCDYCKDGKSFDGQEAVKIATLTPPNEALTCEGCACEEYRRDTYPCNCCARNDETISDQYRPPEGDENT